MAESFKYIEVLCDVGASLASLSKDYPIRFEDAPPIFELSKDWECSYTFIKNYYDSLVRLDYNSVYMESRQQNAEEILRGWHSSSVSCISWSFLIDNCKTYYSGMKELFEMDFRNCVHEYTWRGKWTYKQGQDFMFICSEILRLWEKRITELCMAYGHPSPRLDAPKIKRPHVIVEMFTDPETCDDFFSVKMPNASQWAHRTAEFAKHGKLYLRYKNGEKLLFGQIQKEHKSITSFDSYRQTLYNLGIKPKKET